MPSPLITPNELPPVESFANEAWGIDEAHFDRMLAAYEGSHPESRISHPASRIANPAPDIFRTEGTKWPEPQVIGGAAILPLYGVLAPSQPWWRNGTSTERFGFQFLSALDNPDVKQIVLRINSPGGLMYGTTELCDLIYRARGQKPITAFVVNGLMASAAYLIGSAADRVVATPSSYIGNIGVILAHSEYSKLEAEVGVKFTVLCRPASKKYGNEHEPLSAEAHKALMATLIDPVYQMFAERVGRNRGAEAEEIMEGYGQGLAVDAAAAKAANLIDDVQDWNQFLTQLSGGDTGTATTQTLPPTPLRLEQSQMDFSQLTEQTKAILLAAGIIKQLDVDGEHIELRVEAWSNGRGIDMPADAEALEAEARKSLAPIPVAEPITGQAKPDGAATADPPASQPADPPDVDGAVQKALAAERTRTADIRARAELLGLAPDGETVTEAINGGLSAAAFAEQVMVAAQKDNQPIGRVDTGGLSGGEAALDKFTAAAQNAMVLRCGPTLMAAARQDGNTAEQAKAELEKVIGETPGIHEVAGMSFAEIARKTVELAGIRPSQRTPEGYAKAFLRMGETGEERVFARGNPLIDGALGAYAAPLQGPADLPNLMDGVANKIVLFAIGMAPVNYFRVCSRTDDMPDYNPKQIVYVAGIPEFDEQEDAKPVKQHGFSELDAYIQVDEYSKGTKLTPRMIVNGNMTAFARALVMFQIGLERTFNRLFVDILLDNATCPIDNVALFHTASHANIVTSGGAPSLAQAKAMRKLINAQAMPGDTEEAGLDLDWCMTGSAWVTENQQIFDQRFRVTPATVAESNVFNGSVTPLYEPMISSGGNTYYAGCDPNLLEGIVYAFLNGSGPGGQRVTYFDPETRSQSFDFYGRIGFQLVNYQPFVRNPGE